MHIGFTGTQRGLTLAQHDALSSWMRDRFYAAHAVLHHGDCIGADAAAAQLAFALAWRIVCHPPLVDSKRAFVQSDEMREAKPYLERNREIVNESELLIACPGEAREQRRSGTWSTVRYAGDAGREVVIIYPDGSVVCYPSRTLAHSSST